MNRFESIHIQGYRRLLDVPLQMRPLTVMIGANGAGKTSFLEVWSLLAAACAGQLSAKISELGGLSDLITRDKAASITFNLSMSVPNHAPLDYHLQIEPQGPFYSIKEETLTQQIGMPGSRSNISSLLAWIFAIIMLMIENWCVQPGSTPP